MVAERGRCYRRRCGTTLALRHWRVLPDFPGGQRSEGEGDAAATSCHTGGLEQRMTALEEVPARVGALESQIVQLRGEMQSEFAALRMEMRAGDEETRGVIREELWKTRDELIQQFRGELRGEIGQVRGEIGQVRGEVDSLRGEMKAMGDRLEAAIQEARNHSRVMFEELIERIARIGEGASRRSRRKS
jgi:chromosome segregation ATPase